MDNTNHNKTIPSLEEVKNASALIEKKRKRALRIVDKNNNGHVKKPTTGNECEISAYAKSELMRLQEANEILEKDTEYNEASNLINDFFFLRWKKSLETPGPALKDVIKNNIYAELLDDEVKYHDTVLADFKSIFEKYKDEYETLTSRTSSETKTTNYSLFTDGTNDLDYYSPRHDDLHIWGARRGRMAKRITEKTHIGCEYCYDNEGTLICVKRRLDPDKPFYYISFLLYDADNRRVISLMFRSLLDGKAKLEWISRFSYDENNKMILAETCDINSLEAEDNLHNNKSVPIGLTVNVELNGYDSLGQFETMAFGTYMFKRHVIESSAGEKICLPAFNPYVYKMIRDGDGYLEKYLCRGITYNILGGKNKKVKDVPQLPNLDRIFSK